MIVLLMLVRGWALMIFHLMMRMMCVVMISSEAARRHDVSIARPLAGQKTRLVDDAVVFRRQKPVVLLDQQMRRWIDNESLIGG